MSKKRIRTTAVKSISIAWRLLLTIILIAITVVTYGISPAAAIVMGVITGLAIRMFYEDEITAVLKWVADLPKKVNNLF